MELLSKLGMIFLIVGASFLLINIRYIFTKQEFRGGCASNNPMLKDKFGACPTCGRQSAEEECKMPEKA